MVASVLGARALRSGRLRAVEHGSRADGGDADHGEGARAASVVLACSISS